MGKHLLQPYELKKVEQSKNKNRKSKSFFLKSDMKTGKQTV